MGSLRKLVVFALIAVTRAQGNATETKPEDWEADQCDCYLTDGIEPEYYTQHRFWDFRNLGEYAEIPDTIAGENASAEADVTSKYFKKKEWEELLVHSKLEQPKKSRHSCFLSIRFLGRVRGAPGACMAMFTYVPADEIKNVQEADMEILTREDYDRVHYTNHPGYSIEGEVYPKATRNTTLPDGLKWNEWVEHRMDWTPNQSIWYANGKQVANISFQVPRDPSLMIFNTWGDGGVWTQNMTMGEEAYMEMQWLQLLYNTSETSDKRKRHNAGPKGRFLRKRGDENVCRMKSNIERL
uniref:GH16 domain-containing protein n=1 Tax=Fusarium oxysporum (strain Fo5176) TaxID=660025 RepID=A0A0D2YE96_FUSOF